MPAYDFRCNECGEEFSQFYKSISAYANATTTCPNCESTDLARVIDKVNVGGGGHDYTKMGVDEMLGVFEAGDSKEVGKMFNQIGGTNPALGAQYHETTRRLMDGESMDTVEKDLQSRQAKKDTPKTPSPKAKD